MGGFGFGPGGGFASGAQPVVKSTAIGSRGYPAAPPAQCTPATPAPAPGRRTAGLVDQFYSDLAPNEALFVRREARKAFSGAAQINDGSGDLIRFVVPQGQTFVLTGADFYADGPDTAGALPLPDGSLRGSLAFAVLFDGRVPYDVYAEIDVAGTPDPTGIVRGSFFSGMGPALGKDACCEHLKLRAREGTEVRASYAVLRAPFQAVGHIGAVIRGFLVPSAIFDSKAP